MSKRTGRSRRRTRKRGSRTAPVQRAGESTPVERDPANSLARLLATPHLARVVPQIAPEALHQLIRRFGLDVCAEIVAAATPAQLTSVFDLDLWRSARAGQDERFDAERFGEWLEQLIDAGDAVAGRVAAAMDEHLVIAGLSQYIRVFDAAAMVTTLDGEPVDGDVDTHRGPECHVGGYLVRGIKAGAWDAIVALLLALEADHPHRFHAVMRGCRRVSNSTPEVDGLDDLLTAPQQMLHDAARDRESRRTRQGYSTPADARAFLSMARRPRPLPRGEPSVNPIVAAYFRAITETRESDNVATANAPRPALASPATAESVADALDAVADLVALADLGAKRPRALLEGAHPRVPRFARLHALLEFVRDADEAVYSVRSQEMAFLANTLAAGCSIQSRSFTPQEAADAAVAVCNLGLEHWPADWASPLATPGAGPVLPDTFLIDHDLVSAFEAGWAILHERVSMFVAGQLLVALSDLRFSDIDIQRGVDGLRIELARQCEAGTPWRARHALEVLATLDVPAWVSVLGLLDEYPVIPAALTATLERRTGAISATEFELISTRSHLQTVEEYMARFPDLLLR